LSLTIDITPFSVLFALALLVMVLGVGLAFASVVRFGKPSRLGGQLIFLGFGNAAVIVGAFAIAASFSTAPLLALVFGGPMVVLGLLILWRVSHRTP
jgi:hypothetical protein